MSEVDDFLVSLSPEEQSFALHVTSRLQDVFEELARQGYLRTSLRAGIERLNFTKILEDSDYLFGSYNMLFNIFRERGGSREFLRHNEKFGLYEKGLAYLFLSESVSTFLRNIELFKNCFLFILKMRRGFRIRMTLGQLLQKLVEVTGTKGEAIAEKIDVDLGNGLAHGSFWVDKTELIYCEDITLKEQKRIRLDKLWINTRRQSITTQCLIRLIVDWYSGT